MYQQRDIQDRDQNQGQDRDPDPKHPKKLWMQVEMWIQVSKQVSIQVKISKRVKCVPIVTMEIGPYHVIKVYKEKDILGQGPDHCHCHHP